MTHIKQPIQNQQTFPTNTATRPALTTSAPPQQNLPTDRLDSNTGVDSDIEIFSQMGKNFKNTGTGSSIKAEGLNKYQGGSQEQGQIAWEPIGAPKQERGLSQSTVRTKTYKTEAEAEADFRLKKEKLMRPGGWNSKPIGLTYADAPAWSLHDSKGKEAMTNRRAEKGDLLKIEAPGMSRFFVQVKDAKNEKDNVEFTVAPTRDPQAIAEETSHFFEKESTRTFSLQRDGKQVRFTTLGRNEKLNTGNQSGYNSTMNAVQGLTIMGGGGDVYWDNFADNLLK